MKKVGVFFLLIGLVLMATAAFFYFRQNSSEISPIPADNGVKVIFVTPTP